jgi:hypothetical protein
VCIYIAVRCIQQCEGYHISSFYFEQSLLAGLALQAYIGLNAVIKWKIQDNDPPPPPFPNPFELKYIFFFQFYADEYQHLFPLQTLDYTERPSKMKLESIKREPLLYLNFVRCIITVLYIRSYTEPVLINVYGVPELIPRNEFRQPM